ncbi:hypothetical protein O6H91_11G077400 [Diphasiastrum complanatum]|nr:hypothetical protein O6H91_11G077400 [Diphasiastrum complanatum]
MLVSLLRAGDRDIYRHVFTGAIMLIEDLVSVASFFATPTTFVSCTSISIHCFRSAYTKIGGLESDPSLPLFCSLPSYWTPPDGQGLLVDVTGEARWLPLAEAMINLVSCCMTEGALHIEHLIMPSTMIALGTLLCYGESKLHKVLFDALRVALSIVDPEFIPAENLIRSIVCILSTKKGSPLSFRTMDYDSSLGACLVALYSSTNSGVIERTAQELLGVLPVTIKYSSSTDLKVAMCDILSTIIKHCPIYSKYAEFFLDLAFIPEISHPLSYALQQAWEAMRNLTVDICEKEDIVSFLFFQDGQEKSLQPNVLLLCPPNGTEGRADEPGYIQNCYVLENEGPKLKKPRLELQSGPQKTEDATPCIEVRNMKLPEVSLPHADNVIDAQKIGVHTSKIVSKFTTVKQTRSPPLQSFENRVLQVIETLEPEEPRQNAIGIESLLAALFVFAAAFSKFGTTMFYDRIVEQVKRWICWIKEKGRESPINMTQLSLFVELLDRLVIEHAHAEVNRPVTLEPFSATRNRSQSSIIDYWDPSELLTILEIVWSKQAREAEVIRKTKFCVLKIFAKIQVHVEATNVDNLLTLALHDDDAGVRAEALTMVPVLAATTYVGDRIKGFCELLMHLQDDKSVEVQEALAQVVGLMACICAANITDSSNENLSRQNRSTGFLCSKCDNIVSAEAISPPQYAEKEKENSNEVVSWSLYGLWQPLFTSFLSHDAIPYVQVTFVHNVGRLLNHASERDLEMTKDIWNKCLDTLILHEKRSVREAFCSQIHYFAERRILAGVLGHMDDAIDKKEIELLGKLRCALVVTEDPDVVETLMETVAEIAKAARNNKQLLFFSVVLLIEQLDRTNIALGSLSVSLILEVATLGWPASGTGRIKYLLASIREEIFEYLSARLISRPLMIREFAEAVMNVEFSDFLKEMIPVVLPKLILDQQHNEQALFTLREFARQLETDLPLLLLEWCHKVLSILLLRANGEELMVALQFYESQTGSDPREIFAAVLPALLDELVRFLGDTDSEEALRRSARVAPMIQEVASIVSGSDDLPSFLKLHFVGLLNSIDRKLLRTEDVPSQRQALRCIERLLDMIGPHLNAFVPKILTLLTRAVQEEHLQSTCLNVWLSFVRKLAHVSPSNLKIVASQIVAALMPCLEGPQTDQAPHLSIAAEILEELVVSNKDILEDQARELPLLPSLPALAKVNSVLQEARGVLSLHNQLCQAADGLRHENLSVCYATGVELKKVLRAKRKDITSMILGEAAIDADVISNLFTALLRGCAEESRTSIGQKFKLVCAECLGELGAVDPVKLQVNLRRHSKIERSDEDLLFELINEHLARVLRAASDTDVQDAAALAIQELLKIGGCQTALVGRATHSGPSKSKMLSHITEAVKSSSKDGGVSSSDSLREKGLSLWSRFSDDVKDIIAPCLTSKYLLKHSGAVIPSGPIFRPGMSFRRWMYLWIRRLVSQATGQRSEIFTACRGVIRHDMGTAIFLLPYLLLNVVCDGSSEARTSVTDEILAVLAEAACPDFDLALSNGIGECISNQHNWSGPSEVSIQAVFTLLDNMGQWLDDCKQNLALNDSIQAPMPSKATRSNASQPTKEASRLAMQCDHVSQVLAAIPKQALAGASFRCQAYARAFLYFETYVREKCGALNPAAESTGSFAHKDVTFLLEIYGGLDEPDGLSGLALLRSSSSLRDQVLINEKAGNWAEALTCCEQALQLDPNSLTRQSGVLDCLLNMGHLQTMITHVDGLIARMPDYIKEWSMRGVQAAWRLGQWDLLDEYVIGADSDGIISTSTEGNASFDLRLAKIFQALRKRDHYKVAEQLMQCRLALLAPLAAASMESYARAYPVVVKLHMLQELEDFNSMILTADEDGKRHEELAEGSYSFTKEHVVQDWEGRLKITQPSLWTREPILALRRLVYSASNMPSEVGGCWLHYAKLCRAAGHYETANRAILQAQSSGALNSYMERAKLLWDTKRTHCAISELQQALVNAVPTEDLGVRGTMTSGSEDPNVAKALLLIARWVHHTGQKQKEDVISLYTRVKELQPRWEKSYFFMAKYYDDLLADARRRQEETPEMSNNRGTSVKRQTMSISGNAIVADEKSWWTYLPDALLFYAKGLHKGHRHLFQALPRLLTLWFEFGTVYQGETMTKDKGVKTIHARVMSIMRGCLKDLPTYQWLTALPQLVSRICHQNEEVVRLVKHIITTVLQAYPQQALWTMAAVSKSTVPARREAAAEILQQARNAAHQERDRVLFNQFTGLCEQMIKLCFYAGQPKAQMLSISAEFSSLKRMMPVGVVMPIQRALTVTLPANGVTDSSYNPFPAGDDSTISGIKDDVEILASLQRPKKVVLIGSDGTDHPFLCKPKDDLRKDARMMEFTTMINRLLSKDPKSRRRRLYIRTFAVIPLTEDCGMVEWVLHTRGLRHILQDIYVACGKFDRQKTNPTIKHTYKQYQEKLSGAELLRTKLLPMFPPVFHKWFVNTFSEPESWFQARVAYARTTAVWSMVGHIVGLGDRHGENILFDSTSGDCVHVDFSCLFDKGLQLEKPELVPFRLTQNMVDGLGITGYEGVFSRVCEITLSVLRAHRETLMSVLVTFIHDPLVEWTKYHKSSGVEVQNPHAQRALANIEARLQGVVVGVGAAPSLPLSVEGQAHRLIAEAVSLENLGKMYIWWMPWF